MTKYEINLRIFEREEIPGVFFQPRIEGWYQWNKTRGTLPKRYQQMSLIEVFDDLETSIRYFAFMTGLPSPFRIKYTKEVKIEEKIEGKKKFIITNTPKGELVEERKQASDGVWCSAKYPIKTAEDIEKAICFFQNRTSFFEKENFEKGNEFVGDRGFPQFFFPRSPYQSLSISWMGTENLIYALADFPEKVERLMEAMDNSYDNYLDEIISYGKVKIINFGENIDANIASPFYFEKYCIPFYEKRCKPLKDAGIYTHIHIDGSFKPLLKYLKSLPFDGLEALTPLPQGDVTLEEMKEAVGDKVLLDVIPAIIFLPNYPLEEFKEYVKKVIDLFCPMLILGVSDELPPPADIERVRWISRYCQNLGNERAASVTS